MSDTPVTETVKEEVAGARKLSDADFAEATNLYELGQEGLRELADKYGCSRQNLFQRFKNAGVKKGSRTHELTDAAAKSVIEAAKEAALAATRFTARRADLIEETRMQGLAQLKQTRLLAQKVVTDAIKGGHSLASVDEDMKMIQRFSKMLTENLTTSLLILKSDEHVDQEDMPVLRIEDLTNDDILRHHKNSGVLEQSATVDDLNLPDLAEMVRQI